MSHNIYLTNKSKTPDIKINGYTSTVLTDPYFLSFLDKAWARNYTENYNNPVTKNVTFENKCVLIDYEQLSTKCPLTKKNIVKDPDQFIESWLIKLSWPSC